jgi:hypothetical protein
MRSDQDGRLGAVCGLTGTAGSAAIACGSLGRYAPVYDTIVSPAATRLLSVARLKTHR